MDENWIFEASHVEPTLRELRFPEEVITALTEGAAQVAHDAPARVRFQTFRREWLEGTKVRLQAEEEPDAFLWHALAVASALPQMIALHRAREIPWEITVDTAEDLPRRMIHTRSVHGRWGLDVVHWLRHPVIGNLFQIGRLQYIPSPMYYRVEVYRHEGRNIALAADGLGCKADGWPYDPEVSPADWTTTLRQDGEVLIGHPITSAGTIVREPISIPVTAERLLTAESHVLHVHIPMGKKLDTEACRDSIRRALPFFERHFPERHVEAICCGSWLLDRAFLEFEPVPEKIVSFGQLFTGLPTMNTNDSTHYHWAFGQGFDYEKAKALEKKTSLQQAMINYVAQGGVLRSTGGYITRADALNF